MPVHNLSDTPDHQTEITASVCVIGAGIAGLAAATRLARQNVHRSIVVVESGGKTFDQATHNLNTIDDAFGTYQGALNGRYRGLGGTSSHWGGRLLPLAVSDYAARPYVGLEAWPLDLSELQRYRDDVERLFKVDTEAFGERILARFDKRSRVPRNDADFTLRFPKWPTFRNCNVAYLTKDDVEKSPNLNVWLSSTVNRFGFDDSTRRLNSISAQSFSGKTLKINASEFLFAAGTIETTRLLLLLNQQTEGKAFPQGETLGRYFQDHLAAAVAMVRPVNRPGLNGLLGYNFIENTRRSLHFELTAAAQKKQATASAFAHVTMTIPETSPLNVIKKTLRGFQRGTLELTKTDIVNIAKSPLSIANGAIWRFGKNQLYFPEDIELQFNVWIEQLPDWKNRISLSDKTDPLGSPLARVEWRPLKAEERTFQACISLLREYWQRHNLSTLGELDWLPFIRDKSATVISTASDLLHPSGSTRMGTTAANSVVNTKLQTHEIENISVASASVFPSSGSANPTYTILQLAFYAADMLSARMR